MVEVPVREAIDEILHVRSAGAFTLNVVRVAMQARVQDDGAELADIVKPSVHNGPSQTHS